MCLSLLPKTRASSASTASAQQRWFSRSCTEHRLLHPSCTGGPVVPQKLARQWSWDAISRSIPRSPGEAYSAPRCHRERLLVESDHGWADPPGAIPHRVIWVEYLLAASLRVEVMEVRQLVWQNFSEVVRLTGTRGLLPTGFTNVLDVGGITY